MGYIGSKPRSTGQIIEEPMLVIKGLGFKYVVFTAIPHNLQDQGE